MKAIEIIRESIVTHTEWAEYFEKNHAMENDPEYKKLGNALFHRKCIKRYNEAIAEIEQLQIDFWDGFLIGIVTVVVLIAIGIALCHFCGYPVIIFEQALKGD